MGRRWEEKEKEDEHKQNAGSINGKHQIKAINHDRKHMLGVESRKIISREDNQEKQSRSARVRKKHKSQVKSIESSKLILAGQISAAKTIMACC